MRPGFAEIEIAGRPLSIEVAWVGREDRDAPLLVFLHEGLGSVSMWRDFPQALCREAGARGLVYSRPGYGRSTPRRAEEVWGVDYLHHQARHVLPALLDVLGIASEPVPPWLVGHSDGGSIALLYAARFPQRVAGLVVMAPHILVEPISLQSITAARDAYLHGDLRDRLARHHDDPDSAFWGWNEAWLQPAFRDWSIADEIATISRPVLAMRGLDDEYGTLEQIRGIARVVPQTVLLELPGCGHSPHRDQREGVIAEIAGFVRRHGGG